MKIKSLLFSLILFSCLTANSIILLNHKWYIQRLSYMFGAEIPKKQESFLVMSSSPLTPSYVNTVENLDKVLNNLKIEFSSRNEFYLNLMESIEIAHILNSYCYNEYATKLLHFYCKDSEANNFFQALRTDNSLYFTRLAYVYAGIYDNNEKARITLRQIDKSTVIERAYLIASLANIYSQCSKDVQKEIVSKISTLWETTQYISDCLFLYMAYLPTRQDFDCKYDNLENRFGMKLYNDLNKKPMPSYFYFTRTCKDVGFMSITPSFEPNLKLEERLNIVLENDVKVDDLIIAKYKNAYADLINERQFLDADFTFYWFRNAYNEQIINLARNHIKNPEFKDARYKTVYYLVNHDFDTSFPVLTNMVQNGELCHNEIRNFYRGLARLNKLTYSVITPKQQQKANDYLKQQMLIEKDPSMKLYIDFLLSICIDDYSLSSERITLLNKFKDITGISDEDKNRIDRRLYIIKWTKLQHYPSVFYSYVNGLDDKKPFIDVSKVDVQTLPIYYVEYGDNLLAYHDVNSEAYLAYNTNKISSQNIIIPSELDGYPVTAIAPYAFAGFRHSSTNVLIPSSVNNLFMYSFAYNTNLLSVAIPNSVTNIGVGVFSRSLNMETVFLDIQSELSDDDFYVKAKLNQNCKIIRTKFENGLPIIPLENGVEEEPQLP